MSPTPESRPQLDRRVDSIRRFNRFYTQQIGVLPNRYLGSSLSLAEVRVLFELAHRDGCTATQLAAELGLDPGYLSRILLGFQKSGLITRRRSATDGRQRDLRLTAKGRNTFKPLNRQAHDQIRELLKRLPESRQAELIDSLTRIESLFGRSQPQSITYILRPPRPGDMGWVIHRHGALYAQEYGWDDRFEALVADIVTRFMHDADDRRQRAWIAERDGRNVGCIFCARKSATIAQLRLLLVEPEARGMAIGTRLVDECLRFARSAGYRKIILWTNDVLHAARRIYQNAGFELLREEKHHSFGHDLVGQFWQRSL